LRYHNKIYISLQNIYGIGKYRALTICYKNNINAYARVDELSQKELNSIRKFIEFFYHVEGDLRSQILINIKKLLDMQCYRGIRHKNKLPSRGQRTHTNAKTNKIMR